MCIILPAVTRRGRRPATPWRHRPEGSALAGGRLCRFTDPDGVWGLGVIKAVDEGAALAITEADPVIRSGLGLRYEVTPMISAIT
jgi:hypothetical protein